VLGKNDMAIKYKLVRRDRIAASCSALTLALAISLASFLSEEVGCSLSCCSSMCKFKVTVFDHFYPFLTVIDEIQYCFDSVFLKPQRI